MLTPVIKRAVIVLAGLLAAGILLLAYLLTTFNPNDYKSEIIALVQAKKQRTLVIKGDITLNFWPKIGANLGEISLSERNAPARFAAIKSAKVALALLPLLQKKLVVDTVYLDGAEINVTQYQDGHFNFDDLLSDEKDEPSKLVEFDVQGVNITNAQLSFSNEATGGKYRLNQLALKTGQIAVKSPFNLALSFHMAANQSLMDAQASVKANVMADPEAQHFVVKALDAALKGNFLDGKDVLLAVAGDLDVNTANSAFAVSGFKLSMQGDFAGNKREVSVQAPAITINPRLVSSEKVLLALKQQNAQGDVQLDLALDALKGNQQVVESHGITADLKLITGARKVVGHFSSPIKANLVDKVFDVPSLAGKFDIQDPELPSNAMAGEFKLGVNANLKQEKVNTVFTLLLAETKLNGDAHVDGFSKPHIGFSVNADMLDLNALLGKNSNTVVTETKVIKDKKADNAADFSALKTLFIEGSVNIGKILYAPYTLTALKFGIKADGQKLALDGLNVKLDDTTIQGNVGISQFSKPLYNFDLNIDKVDINRYLPQQSAAASANTTEQSADSSADMVVDLSPLKALNAQGNIRIGWLKYGKTEAKNLTIGLQSQGGVAQINPLHVDVYQGTIRGAMTLDGRAVPAVKIRQTMQNIAVEPLLADTVHNGMLSGKGTLSLDLMAQGGKMSALKKSLSGNIDLKMTDGAVNGLDIAGVIREAKATLNVLKKQDYRADLSKKTDFSELTASFQIKNGVAYNEDLTMKAPLFRLSRGESKGTIDIGKETMDYLARPTLVNSLKGQGGKEAAQLASIGIPIKLTGTFSAPNFNIDMAALGQALAKSVALNALTDKLGGKAGLVSNVLGTQSGGDTTEKPEANSKPADMLKQKALKNLLKF